MYTQLKCQVAAVNLMVDLAKLREGCKRGKKPPVSMTGNTNWRLKIKKPSPYFRILHIVEIVFHQNQCKSLNDLRGKTSSASIKPCMNPLGQAEQHSLPGTRSDTQAWREKWLLLLLLVLLVVIVVAVVAVVAVVLQLLFQIVWNSTRATIDWEWCIASTEITCCTPLVVRTSPKQSAKPNVILIKHPFF